ncbi:MAG: hypothetical protein IT195_12430 [Microthrixaceae bacterium]|nr:hypothetical protein [Microthrixaceae bacterium]
MTLDHRPAFSPAPAPGRIGQGTAVEQSRAVAEVQALVIVAQNVPRNVSAARAEMQASCKQLGLAERAFYKYNRGGQTIAGASVHLARELARCWRNVQFGVVELRRDDIARQSEMQAFAWDVETNTRISNTFIVPHLRDKKGGPVELVELRDIYENNANNAARRLREAIFSILPPWFTEEAITICHATINAGDGREISERTSAAIESFAKLGVDQDRIERKLGKPSTRWDQYDLTQLTITHRSITRGEVAIDDEFPPLRASAAEIAANAAAAAAAEPGDAVQQQLPTTSPASKKGTP